jgi:sulfide:quinone oxidoreductase
LERAATTPVRVLIAGGGVAALEALLALRHLAEERVDLTLVCPDTELRYRPASVAVPFGRGEVYHYSLADIATAVGARLVHGDLRQVDTEEHQAMLGTGGAVAYDVLVIAIGARRRPVMDGAIPFRGDEDVPAIEKLLGEIRSGTAKHVVFALPRGSTWALPLYELALLTAGHVAEHRIQGVSINLVTPEERPLAQFGGAVSDAVQQLLDEHRVALHTGVYPVSISHDRLMLVPAAVVPADRVVCIPAAVGVPITGLSSDNEGFLAVDELGQVRGVDDVFAVGDITSYPIKQGGIAAQQADLAAHVIANRAGATLGEPAPLRPVLRGLLITGGQPQYLVADLGGGRGDTAVSSTEPLWWPGAKVAAHYLGPYLAHAPHRIGG